MYVEQEGRKEKSLKTWSLNQPESETTEPPLFMRASIQNRRNLNRFEERYRNLLEN